VGIKRTSRLPDSSARRSRREINKMDERLFASIASEFRFNQKIERRDFA
jgi:hypothetical protein